MRLYIFNLANFNLSHLLFDSLLDKVKTSWSTGKCIFFEDVFEVVSYALLDIGWDAH